MKRIASYKTLLLTGILMLSSFLVFNSISSPQAAEISVDIKAGDTIWYNVEVFSPLDSLEVPVNTTEGSVSGSLVGSQVYVKIMKVQKETLTYYDGSVVRTGLVPTVDISTGGILGQSISFSVPTDTGFEEVIIPAGAGLPIPINFGTTTLFNVSQMPDSVVPLPLVLNDDYIMHETVANQLKTLFGMDGGTITVVNDAAEFSLDAYLPDDTSTDFIDFFGSWRKTDGLLQTLQISASFNGSLVDIRLALDRKEYKPLNINVGDEWNLFIKDMGFDYTLTGHDAQEQLDITTELDLLLEDMQLAVGQFLYNLTVVEIDGLYYRVEGSIYSNDTDTMEPIVDDLWLTGFGTLNYQLPRHQVSSIMTTVGKTEADLQRLLSDPGFAVTEDWEIYKAFDLSISTFVGNSEKLLNAYSNMTGIMDIAYNGAIINNGYQVNISSNIDVSGPFNDSDPLTSDPTINIRENSEGSMTYDKSGLLTELSFTGSGSSALTTGETIEITNARIILTTNVYAENSGTSTSSDDSSTSDSENTQTDGTDTGTDTETDTDGTDTHGSKTEESPTNSEDDPSAVPLPGFGFYLALSSIISIGFIQKKRRRGF